jgi:hypothetical protein
MWLRGSAPRVDWHPADWAAGCCPARQDLNPAYNMLLRSELLGAAGPAGPLSPEKVRYCACALLSCGRPCALRRLTRFANWTGPSGTDTCLTPCAPAGPQPALRHIRPVPALHTHRRRRSWTTTGRPAQGPAPQPAPTRTQAPRCEARFSATRQATLPALTAAQQPPAPLRARQGAWGWGGAVAWARRMAGPGRRSAARARRSGGCHERPSRQGARLTCMHG